MGDDLHGQGSSQDIQSLLREPVCIAAMVYNSAVSKIDRLQLIQPGDSLRLGEIIFHPARAPERLLAELRAAAACRLTRKSMLIPGRAGARLARARPGLIARIPASSIKKLGPGL